MPVQSKLAKAMASKSKAGPKVKKETKTPDRRIRGKCPKAKAVPEPGSDGDGEPKGVQRGTVSALLTSLKYQTAAKKNSESQRNDAAAALQDRSFFNLIFACSHVVLPVECLCTVVI